jgi:hypothetical protein
MIQYDEYHPFAWIMANNWILWIEKQLSMSNSPLLSSFHIPLDPTRVGLLFCFACPISFHSFLFTFHPFGANAGPQFLFPYFGHSLPFLSHFQHFPFPLPPHFPYRNPLPFFPFSFGFDGEIIEAESSVIDVGRWQKRGK